jgi:signal transduction histidine kinase
MHVLQVAALVVYTFGAFAYAALLAMSLREVRQPAAAPRPPAGRTSLTVGLALWTLSCAWFFTNLLLELVRLGPPINSWPLDMAGLWLACAFPPLIVHITWAEVVETRSPAPGRTWSLVVWPAYTLAATLAVASTLGFSGVGGLSPDAVGRAASIGLVSLFLGASIYAAALLTQHPQPSRSVREQQSHRWHIALFAIMALLFVALLRSSMHGVPTTMLIGRTLEISVKSLPIAFMFAGTYFEYRFEFFDLFIKRGLALVVTIGVLAVAFAVVLPWLQGYNQSWAAPWVYAIVLLPAALALPWLHARLGAVLDRRWLGRRFTTVAAVQHFLASLRPATGEAQLVERAEDGLAEIFDAPARVVLEGRTGSGTDVEIVETADIQLAGRLAGRILMGRRRSEAPYFSEDTALLASLADVFASVLENVRLQQREQEKDRTARELSLHASRSELKALRAQINPHFLFNALNAIAGLIHRDPDVADRTVEKLADVFRYALRGSDSEWAVLDDELEFVRAYLEVEQARFGAKLGTEVRLHKEARGARVPTMIVQTLVENAVKHGAAAVRDHAVVTIDARRDGDLLLIVVEDNGPGLAAAEDRRGTSPQRGGFGLASIRQRLAGHFGAAAALTIERDRSRAVTTASVTLPFVRDEPRPAAADALERVER